MTERDLWRERRARWRLSAEKNIRTAADAAEFLADVGLCLMYPPPAPLVLPSFAGACRGSDALPAAQVAARDPRTAPARELAWRAVRAGAGFEAPFADQDVLLFSPDVFPYFYAVTGERTPARALEPPPAREPRSQLRRDVFRLIHRNGAISKQRLRQQAGAQVSEAALDRVLRELWRRLLIARVDYKEDEGAIWDTLPHWAPQVVKQAAAISLAEGLSALVSKYVDAAIAAPQKEIEALFANFTSRGRVREAMQALLAAREFSFAQVGRKNMIQVTQREARHPGARAGAGS